MEKIDKTWLSEYTNAVTDQLRQNRDDISDLREQRDNDLVNVYDKLDKGRDTHAACREGILKTIADLNKTIADLDKSITINTLKISFIMSVLVAVGSFVVQKFVK